MSQLEKWIPRKTSVSNWEALKSSTWLSNWLAKLNLKAYKGLSEEGIAKKFSLDDDFQELIRGAMLKMLYGKPGKLDETKFKGSLNRVSKPGNDAASKVVKDAVIIAGTHLLRKWKTLAKDDPIFTDPYARPLSLDIQNEDVKHSETKGKPSAKPKDKPNDKPKEKEKEQEKKKPKTPPSNKSRKSPDNTSSAVTVPPMPPNEKKQPEKPVEVKGKVRSPFDSESRRPAAVRKFSDEYYTKAFAFVPLLNNPDDRNLWLPWVLRLGQEKSRKHFFRSLASNIGQFWYFKFKQYAKLLRERFASTKQFEDFMKRMQQQDEKAPAKEKNRDKNDRDNYNDQLNKKLFDTMQILGYRLTHMGKRPSRDAPHQFFDESNVDYKKRNGFQHSSVFMTNLEQDINDLLFHKENGIAALKGNNLYAVREQLLDVLLGASRFWGQLVSNLNYRLIGNPGAGKSRLAKTLAFFYSRLGILANDAYRDVPVSSLVTSLVNGTARTTTKEVFDSLESVMIIDEAYQLISRCTNPDERTAASDNTSGSHGAEAINTLVELLSKLEGMIVVVFAGYKESINCLFKYGNRGLDRRVPYEFELGFPDFETLAERTFEAFSNVLKTGPEEDEEFRLAPSIEGVIRANMEQLGPKRFPHAFGDIAQLRSSFARALNHAFSHEEASPDKWTLDVQKEVITKTFKDYLAKQTSRQRNAGRKPK